MKKIIFISLAFISIGLGILGIFLPLLPTTPFLLLAAWLLAKSSDRLLQKLLQNKVAGKYLRNYWEGRGIPVPVKITALIFLWTGIGISAFCFGFNTLVQVVLIGFAAIVTIHIILAGKKKKI